MGLLNRISVEIRSLNAIVTEFLDFARPTKLNLECASVAEIVEDALLLLSPKLNRNKVEVIRHWENDKKYAATLDRERLKEAFLNIIVNAAEAMEEKGGRLDIFIRDNAAEEENGRIVEPEIRIEFSNNGPFIPEGEIDKIFNPFYTLKEQGTGLGLAMVHKIVEVHGGTINVVSNEAEGTRFTVCLPGNSLLTKDV
jgi:signal transduction histidine kinase